MANLLQNLFGGTKAKTLETTSKNLEKTTQELGELQAEQQKLNTQKGQLIQAMNVIEASLVIDGNDKQASAQKKKAQDKIQAINTELDGLIEKIQKAQEVVTQARKEQGFSKGEAFKAEELKDITRATTFRKFEDKYKHIHDKNYSYTPRGMAERARAYGLPTEYNEVTKSHTVRNTEAVQFCRQASGDMQGEANEKAEEIVNKTLEYMEKLLADEGIEVQKPNNFK